MRKIVLLLTAVASLTIADYVAKAADHKKPSETVTVVDSESDADATHIYLSQADSTDAGMTKMTYDENPKAFAQGWRDGWKWASKQSDLSSDQPAEDMERKLYGNIDEEPGQTKAIAFFDAMSVLRNRGRSASNGSVPGPKPETDGAWGVSLDVHDAIKGVLNDPDSYKYISVSGPWWTTYQSQPCYLEKVHFRAKNSFGGYVVETASFMSSVLTGDLEKRFWA
jgi:hypothetical protein